LCPVCFHNKPCAFQYYYAKGIFGIFMLWYDQHGRLLRCSTFPELSGEFFFSLIWNSDAYSSWEFEGWWCEQWISQCTLLLTVLQFWPWSNCAPHMVESGHWWMFHILVTVCCESNTSAASAHTKVSKYLILSCHPELYYKVYTEIS
jgi:hypothetical protein